MAEEKMVDLDTTGEGQEVELQEEDKSTEDKPVSNDVEDKKEETEKVEESSEEESKDDGLDKYSKNVQRRIKKLLDNLLTLTHS